MPDEAEKILEEVRKWAAVPVPLAPYWEGQTVADFLEIPLDEDYTLEQWDEIFATFLRHLGEEDGQTRYAVLSRLQSAIWAESLTLEDDESARAIGRIEQICRAVAAQIAVTPATFEEFCHHFHSFADEKAQREVFLSWIKQLAAQAPNISCDALLMARILFGGYGSTWRSAGKKLVAALDYSDLTVRACAAYQIGVLFNRRYRKGLPPISEMLDLMRRKEIERPGVAGAFWYQITGVNSSGEVEIPPDEADEWLLSVLEQSPSPEPYIPLFSCGLAFVAHEHFSTDARAIRRLIDSGRLDIALEAGTEENRRVADLEPLLMEMGNAGEPEMVRQAAWHLAYHYNVLHPRGAELGFVEKIDDLNEIDLFLLFSSRRGKTPYAVVIYAKDKKPLSFERAQHWVDQIFPPSVRGKARKADSYFAHQWFRRGYVDYNIVNVIIGYRSDKAWNPKKFL